jgi:hypothetical protein
VTSPYATDVAGLSLTLPGLVSSGPHAIGTEWYATVSSGTSFAQVADGILREQARVQNPDKDEVTGSSPGRPTNRPSAHGPPGRLSLDAQKLGQRLSRNRLLRVQIYPGRS